MPTPHPPAVDVLSQGRDPRLVSPPPRGTRVLAGVLVAHLAVALGALAQRRDDGTPAHRATSPTPAPTLAAPGPDVLEVPVPSPPPERITAAERARRRRTALNTARFAARLNCRNADQMTFTVVSKTPELRRVVVAGQTPEIRGGSGFVIEVTRLPGAISYRILRQTGGCAA